MSTGSAIWSSAAEDYPRDRCIHQLFEAQVEKAPDAIALPSLGAHVAQAVNEGTAAAALTSNLTALSDEALDGLNRA